MNRKNAILWSVVGVAATGLAVLGWINRQFLKEKALDAVDAMKEKARQVREQLLPEDGLCDDE